MDEAKMSGAKTNDVDLWLMDDRITYDPSLLEGIVVPQEVEDAIEAYFNEVFDEDEVQSAA